jgi:hypothetical protein
VISAVKERQCDIAPASQGDDVAAPPAGHTRYAMRPSRQQRPNRGLFIVGEFIPHDSSLQFGV